MFEEIVEEWISITTLEARLRGPNLKNRLTGTTISFKRLLNNEMLADPDNGVRYFLSTLRPHFVKDVEHMFLWRFLRFFKKTRGNYDITLWIPSWDITFRYLNDAWMDLAPVCTDIQDQTYRQRVVFENSRITEHAQNAHNQNLADFQSNPNQARFVDPETGAPRRPEYVPPNLFDPNAATSLETYNKTVVRPQHATRFPIGDHLLSLIFLANSDLNEQQRERLTSHLALRGMMMRDYSLRIVQESFRTLFCSTRTGIGNPQVRPSGLSHRRNYYLFEAGEFDGEEGYWAEDEDTNEEGFLSTENTTWENSQAWDSGEYEEIYESATGKTWYTSDKGKTWRTTCNSGKEPWPSSGFLVEEITSKVDGIIPNEVYLAGIGRWQKIDTLKHATYVILDSGCTRSMGSRARVMAFVKACRNSGFQGSFQFVP